jgi:hypothetical protein
LVGGRLLGWEIYELFYEERVCEIMNRDRDDLHLIKLPILAIDAVWRFGHHAHANRTHMLVPLNTHVVQGAYIRSLITSLFSATGSSITSSQPTSNHCVLPYALCRARCYWKARHVGLKWLF